MMQQWEYLRLQVEVHDIRSSDQRLSELGLQGWELCGTCEAAGSYLHLWFRRPKS
jgi:hypothetical protein